MELVNPFSESEEDLISLEGGDSLPVQEPKIHLALTEREVLDSINLELSKLQKPQKPMGVQ